MKARLRFVILAFALASPAGASSAPERSRTPPPIEDALDWGRYHAHPDWLTPLGFTREALQTIPASPPADTAMVAEALAGRLEEVERCLPGKLRGEGMVQPASGYASFVLEADGTITAVKVVVDAHEGDAASVRCAEELVSSWVFPRPVARGRVWLPLEGRGGEAKRAPEPRVTFRSIPGRSFKLPAQKRSGCVQERMSKVRLTGTKLQWIRVVFDVNSDGSVSRFQPRTRNVPLKFLRAMEKAVQSCEWTPALDSAGTPVRWQVPMTFELSG